MSTVSEVSQVGGVSEVIGMNGASADVNGAATRHTPRRPAKAATLDRPDGVPDADPGPEVPTADGAGVGVTTGSLARRLGVSPTTLRSWDRRYGIGPAVRADGRHRRWSPRDVSMLMEMCRLTAAGVPPAEAARAAKSQLYATAPAAIPATEGEGPDRPRQPGGTAPAPTPTATPAPAPGPTPDPAPLDPRHASRGLAQAGVRLDAVAVQDLLSRAVARYGLVTAWHEVMMPALQAVGRRWESSDDRYVEVEHLLSWHISATLRHAYVSHTTEGADTDAAPVLLSCLPGEQHTLPLEALAAALAAAGRPVRMLGGSVPGEALVAAVRRLGPSAVVLWSQSRATASEPLADHIAATRWGVRGARSRPLVLLAGPGWGTRPRAGLDRPHSLLDALRLITAPTSPTGGGAGADEM
ncbi:MerR family transcriptional regulator [Streptomyces sp. NPDC058417]|uniref:MerR family transcriptional regulator n=3 Tax=Streptomyces TaxID=1883 RepID=UPI00364B9D13